jgi:hemerythrin
MVTTPIHTKSNPHLTDVFKPARSGDCGHPSSSAAVTVMVGRRPTSTLRWVEAFSLDVPLLDDQHRQLLDHVRVAIAALRCARMRDAAGALESIRDTAQWHFNDEEILMYELEYPGYVNHVEQHRRLVMRVEQLQARLALRRVIPQRAIYDLRSWFALHLLRYDSALATYVNGRRHRG